MAGKFRRVVLAAIVGASLLGASAGGPLSAVSGTDGAPVLENEGLLPLDEARRFRAELGLDTHPGLLERLARTTPPSPTFGLPLTPDEEALLQERARIQNELGPAKEYEATHRAVWGGMWLSYPQGATLDHATTVNVAVTDEPAAHADTLVKLLPQGADLALHRVRYTEDELDALHSDIFQKRSLFRSLGTEIYSITTIVQTNKVEVVVSNPTAEIEQEILAEFPAAMVVVLPGGRPMGDACSRTNCGPPWRGGLKIYRPGPAYCTAGYVASKYAGTWFYQLWTAGHCGTGTWRMGSSSGPVIGTTSVNYFQSDSVDVQAIGIPASAIDDDYLYGTAACTECVQTDIASAEPLNGDTIGAMVRNNGAFSGTQAGTLVATNESIPYLGVTLRNLRRATYTRMQGDSGAPVIRISNIYYGSYNVAAGSHTHYQDVGGTQYALYTHIGFFKNWTGYDVHTSGD